MKKKIATTKVLFVCLGNACRSPMAEAIALRDAPDVIEASSAGLTPLGRIEPMTKETLAKNGFSGFRRMSYGPKRSWRLRWRRRTL